MTLFALQFALLNADRKPVWRPRLWHYVYGAALWAALVGGAWFL